MSIQFIRFSESKGGPLLRNAQLAPGAEWPPPKLLWTITPHGLGFDQALICTDPDVADQLAEYMDEPDNRDRDLRYTMTPWHQVSCSSLDDDLVKEGGHVARGAEYVPMIEEPS